MRVLLVEDDDHVAAALEVLLRQHGHDVILASTGTEAIARYGDAEFVLLDLGLPDLDGTEVCRRIRARSAVPIIVVTARCEEIDRVLGLQIGADDYVIKPFGARELLARIQAVHRRTYGADRTEPAPAGPTGLTGTTGLTGLTGPTGGVVRVGPLEVDTRARRASLDGKPLTLTRKEFDLLLMLAEEPGTVCARQAIIDRVWDENWFGSTRTLDVHVGTLRNKLGAREWVRTVRGVGFRLDPQPATG